MSNRIAPKLLAELIGTFAFVFIGAGASAVVGDGVGLPGITAIALAHGLTITAFAFAYGPVSGGHMNPAVTVGVLAAGAMRAGEAAGYIFSQVVGGVIAAVGDRHDRDLQHRHGWGPYGRRFQPGVGARPNDRNGRSQQCLALRGSPDCWRTHRCHREQGSRHARPGAGEGARPDAGRVNLGRGIVTLSSSVSFPR